MRRLIKETLRKPVCRIRRYLDANIKRRLIIMNNCNIDTLFDIGANNGSYAKNMRAFGYNGRIISFEPLKQTFEELKRDSLKDNNWIVNNYALGNENCKTILNVSSNSWSSSILKILPIHIENESESRYIGQEDIEIKKFDSIFNSFCRKEDRVMIKIDTQGYEKYVIDGAVSSLHRILIIQLEMSIVPLYENEMLIAEMINSLDNKGFQLFSLENGFSNPQKGQLLQVDGIFVNRTIDF